MSNHDPECGQLTYWDNGRYRRGCTPTCPQTPPDTRANAIARYKELMSSPHRTQATAIVEKWLGNKWPRDGFAEFGGASRLIDIITATLIRNNGSPK